MNREHSVIGRIIDVPGTYSEQGNELTPPTYQSGWHVNMTELVPELEQYRVFPAQPYRVYAGAETVFLRFADEGEWLNTAGALGILVAAE
ncbi:hypothetical protein PS862_02867 [Pseudomonas fluorescens]|uniref:Uncharacterized protein n=1 Tax=Pseudomonas fluorescens TaxID=294 RepID=A0A5E7KKS9_PSEFL|nr:hypothetical protein [Pseudomonas fluorescens]VVP01411.1 hypothetical protein PS862_02867 [Pseudomonas fluorescens]